MQAGEECVVEVMVVMAGVLAATFGMMGLMVLKDGCAK